MIVTINGEHYETYESVVKEINRLRAEVEQLKKDLSYSRSMEDTREMLED